MNMIKQRVETHVFQLCVWLKETKILKAFFNNLYFVRIWLDMKTKIKYKQTKKMYLPQSSAAGSFADSDNKDRMRGDAPKNDH